MPGNIWEGCIANDNPHSSTLTRQPFHTTKAPMDPLSVAASVTGLLLAGAKIAALLRTLVDAPSVVESVGVEINHFVVVLAQLQQFMMGSSSADPSRTSMIEVQQIQLILTGCVVTFSELQSAIDNLGQRSSLRAVCDGCSPNHQSRNSFNEYETTRSR